MKIVLISDTHDKHDLVSVPCGDVLIHAGDLTKNGKLEDIGRAAKWIDSLSFKHKIVIAGNHDFALGGDLYNIAENLITQYGIFYLKDRSITIDDTIYYGSPYQPEFFNWCFNLPRGKPLEEKWSQIPDDVNVLITHGPPYGILDLVEDNAFNAGRDLHQGCQDLYRRIQNLSQLKAHCFGHLHFNGGKSVKIGNTIFANGAICTEEYKPTNLPVVFEI